MSTNINRAPDFRRMAEEALRNVPQDISEHAKAFFQKSFIKEGFTDASYIPWVRRQSNEFSHKLLSNSLQLRNSIRIKEANLRRIEVSAGEGVPYAEIHNNGGTISVRVTPKMRRFFWYKFYKTGDTYWRALALTKKDNFIIRIPKRQFIGDSYSLNREIDGRMIQHIQRAERNLNFT